ncbi:hypothetical protein GGS20DRAFT_555129 [Poronia punctata]|nr:hypothetical protein GGS20DRAFT_555129 [Poronia punctata]
MPAFLSSKYPAFKMKAVLFFFICQFASVSGVFISARTLRLFGCLFVPRLVRPTAYVYVNAARQHFNQSWPSSCVGYYYASYHSDRHSNMLSYRK